MGGMTPEQYKQIVIACEGQALANAAGMGGVDGAAESARCVIDGWMNALIRLEGQRAAAEFAFALADRVAGGLREPTPWVPAPAALPAITSPAAAKSQPGRKWRALCWISESFSWLHTWPIGFAAGFFVGWHQ